MEKNVNVILVFILGCFIFCIYGVDAEIYIVMKTTYFVEMQGSISFFHFPLYQSWDNGLELGSL